MPIRTGIRTILRQNFKLGNRLVLGLGHGLRYCLMLRVRILVRLRVWIRACRNLVLSEYSARTMRTKCHRFYALYHHRK